MAPESSGETCHSCLGPLQTPLQGNRSLLLILTSQRNINPRYISQNSPHPHPLFTAPREVRKSLLAWPFWLWQHSSPPIQLIPPTSLWDGKAWSVKRRNLSIKKEQDKADSPTFSHRNIQQVFNENLLGVGTLSGTEVTACTRQMRPLLS